MSLLFLEIKLFQGGHAAKLCLILEWKQILSNSFIVFIGKYFREGVITKLSTSLYYLGGGHHLGHSFTNINCLLTVRLYICLTISWFWLVKKYCKVVIAECSRINTVIQDSYLEEQCSQGKTLWVKKKIKQYSILGSTCPAEFVWLDFGS